MKPLLALLLALSAGCATSTAPIERVMTLREGMSTNEVLAVMGPPTKVREFPADRVTQWTWSKRGVFDVTSGSIVISDGVVFQVPPRRPGSTAEWVSDALFQSQELREKIRRRDMRSAPMRASITVEEQESSAKAIEEELRQIAAKRADEAKAARKAYVDARPDMPQSHRDAIVDKSVMTGMTREDVLTAWGSPESKNVTQGKGWRHEQWVYPERRYLYFKNGRLDAMSFTE